MNWSVWEVFSVISGLIMAVAGVVMPDTSFRERLSISGVGIGFVVYGFYVANQTSGTFEFPIVIFFVPVVALVYVGIQAYEWWTKSDAEETTRD
ncbi:MULTISPECIES: hypothetical protein [unclassified Actinomadura]|uniref:hypothetical protein n=1 Tax=unclassified Actinomadura TaxID=2626254 RepID=UPI0011EBEDD7|nr:hypothetical protein [Actinomadura sp. K4S16]